MYTRAITWLTLGSDVGPSVSIVSLLRDGYIASIEEFVRDYKRVNHQ